MNIVENNVKCGEGIIFAHKFYYTTTNLPSNFVPVVGILSKNFVTGVEFSYKKIGGPGVSGWGMATGKGDICTKPINKASNSLCVVWEDSFILF